MGQLDGLAEDERDKLFVELNVLAQMQVLKKIPNIASAMRSRGLRVHGLVYDPSENKVVRLVEDVESEKAVAK